MMRRRRGLQHLCGPGGARLASMPRIKRSWNPRQHDAVCAGGRAVLGHAQLFGPGALLPAVASMQPRIAHHHSLH